MWPRGQGAQGLEGKGRERGTADLQNHGKSREVEGTSGDSPNLPLCSRHMQMQQVPQG